MEYPQGVATHELAVGDRLADVVRHPSGRFWLAVDELRHELIVLQRDEAGLKVASRHAVSPYPTRIAVAAAHHRIGVASLWSRKVTLFEAGEKNDLADLRLKKIAEVPLRFNPRKLAFRDDKPELLDVFDAFGHTVALINVFPPYLITDPAPAAGGLINSTAYSAWFLPPEVEQHSVAEGNERYLAADKNIVLGPAPKLTPALRGELLFYKKWDITQQYSCNHCHVDAHTNYALADTLGDVTQGTPKRIPTLLGTRLSDPWAWNGRFRNLDEQVQSSLETTMHVKHFTAEQVADITAYLHTLKPPPPLEPATDDPADQRKLARGKDLFQGLGCAKCHVPPLTYTSPETYDVGLVDEKGLRKFNPPSLRGVSQGYSFFHDGRAKTLEEVFTVHGHQLDRALAEDELSSLIRFLRSL